ncbi:hypothetical protein LMG29542_01045 [Paraburkholderia humisilvae]|uniref:Uncharacterized protein n=1 Tax=Paraburkholderia humisilvae TaxID=627669 RepID=A0A6J5D5V9_9BURK|nr:hypothetical protein LMG29542_01045 [Paraburkholderia humisilvae]
MRAAHLQRHVRLEIEQVVAQRVLTQASRQGLFGDGRPVGMPGNGRFSDAAAAIPALVLADALTGAFAGAESIICAPADTTPNNAATAAPPLIIV